jgi:hypothetical protein
MRTLFLAGILCGAVFAQATNTSATPGVMSQWDVTALLSSLEKGASQLVPVIDQMKPDQWTAAGAPQTYAQQWKSARKEVQYLLGSAQGLNQQPERLTLALDTLFRMQTLDRTLESLVQGARKYQSPTLAATMQARLDEASANRDKLRQYVVELAAQREHEFQVMDSEAQRCRGTLAASGSAQRRKTARKTAASPSSEQK